MQWSKLKKNVEDRFARSVKGKVHLYSTAYNSGGNRCRYGSVWITFDGILSCFGTALVTIILCTHGGSAHETIQLNGQRDKLHPNRTSRQSAHESKFTPHKKARKIVQKNQSPKTSLEVETPSRHELNNFLKGKTKSYKGFDSRSD